MCTPRADVIRPLTRCETVGRPPRTDASLLFPEGLETERPSGMMPQRTATMIDAVLPDMDTAALLPFTTPAISHPAPSNQLMVVVDVACTPHPNGLRQFAPGSSSNSGRGPVRGEQAPAPLEAGTTSREQLAAWGIRRVPCECGSSRRVIYDSLVCGL